MATLLAGAQDGMVAMGRVFALPSGSVSQAMGLRRHVRRRGGLVQDQDRIARDMWVALGRVGRDVRER